MSPSTIEPFSEDLKQHIAVRSALLATVELRDLQTLPEVCSQSTE
jgi:hypothetical protein